MNQKRSYIFYPKKPMRSFRDLEVYAKTLACAVTITSSIKNAIPDFFALEGMMQCALSIPLLIAEAHSMRFADKGGGIALLERAMAGCNKMVVYLEEAVGIYGGPGAEIVQARGSERNDAKGRSNFSAGTPGAEVAPVLNSKLCNSKKGKDTKNKGDIGTGALDPDLVNDLIKKYLDVRGKMFRLEQSWKRFDAQGLPHG